jgi:hypothetical protein
MYHLNYETATFWATVVGTIVAVASLVGSLVALAIAKSSLTLAKQVAEQEQRDWKQRKWFDLYAAAENFRTLLERFQTIYDKPLPTLEFEKDANDLIFASRKTLLYASVFPQNPTVDAFFKCIQKWKLDENRFSKKMLAEYIDAIEGFRQEARVPEVLIQKGSAAPMKLNGWRRLWVLVAVLWLLPVIMFSYAGWPAAANISKDDVYHRMKPEDGHHLTDYYDVMASLRTDVETPRVAALKQDKAFLAASAKDQKAYLSATDPDFAKASTLDQNAYLGNITGIKGPTVDIDGHTVQFIRDLPQEDMNQTARAYHGALRQILTRNRAVFVGEAFALWMIPVIALYALVS